MFFEEIAKVLLTTRTLSVIIVLTLVYWGYRKIITTPHTEPLTPQVNSPQHIFSGRSDQNEPINLNLPPLSLITQHHTPPVKVIITTNKIVFTESWQVIPESIQIIKEIASKCDLYLMSQCASKAEEDTVTRLLIQSSVFAKGLVSRHKCMFSQRPIGRQVAHRHIGPTLVIDNDYDVLKAIKPYVAKLVWVDASGEKVGGDAVSKDGVRVAQSLNAYIQSMHI